MECDSCKEKVNHEIHKWINGGGKHIDCGNSDPERQSPHAFSQFGFLVPILQMLVYNLK